MRNPLAMLIILALTACSDPGAPQDPCLEFSGGGFMFNYRIAVVDYGFVATVKRSIKPGTIVEASFENPQGGPPFIEKTMATAGRIQYVFRSPPVHGVKAGKEYQVVLRLRDPGSGQTLAAYTHHFRSNVDQSQMPASPLTVGPGYQTPTATR